MLAGQIPSRLIMVMLSLPLLLQPGAYISKNLTHYYMTGWAYLGQNQNKTQWRSGSRTFLNSAPLKTPIASWFGLIHKLQFSLNCFILGKGQLATTTTTTPMTITRVIITLRTLTNTSTGQYELGAPVNYCPKMAPNCYKVLHSVRSLVCGTKPSKVHMKKWWTYIFCSIWNDS